MQVGRERIKKEKVKRKWGKDENYHMLFQQGGTNRESNENSWKRPLPWSTYHREHTPAHPHHDRASIALYSNNIDWELINTGRGRLVDSAHPKH